VSDKVRIAMLSMAHAHADGYASEVASLPNTELVVIWDDEVDRGKPAAEKFGVPFSTDLDAVLSRSDIDAVVVNSETCKHTDHYLAAISAGKHIFTEKTLTLTTSDADKVVKASNDAGIKFTVSLPSRTRSENLLIRKLVDDGVLGDITLVRGRVGHCATLDNWFSEGTQWFVEADKSGGGAMFDLGCHTTDMVRWIMGPPKSAVALMTTVGKTYDIDDNGVAVVEFGDGGLGVLDSSFVHRAGPNLFEVFGTEGYVGRGFPGQGVVLHSTKLRDDEIQNMTANLPESLPSIMTTWVSAILHGTPLTTTVEDGRNLTEMLEGSYIAWHSGVRHDF
jgi:1,5-anhydro-D-fructose reductase (1,5-anhydro-D-mannitol-forming)